MINGLEVKGDPGNFRFPSLSYRRETSGQKGQAIVYSDTVIKCHQSVLETVFSLCVVPGCLLDNLGLQQEC